MIRPAKFGDVPRLSQLMEEGHKRSRYADVCGIDVKEAKSILVQSIQRHGKHSSGGSCVYVAETSGWIDGYIIGILEPVYHVGDKLSAKDVYFYVRLGAPPSTATRLAQAFFEWTDECPDVVEVLLAATDIIEDYDRVAKLYERWGLVQIGVIYERRAS